MTLQEYIAHAKDELDKMETTWLEEHSKRPALWPMEMSLSEWQEQELADRFCIEP